MPKKRGLTREDSFMLKAMQGYGNEVHEFYLHLILNKTPERSMYAPFVCDKWKRSEVPDDYHGCNLCAPYSAKVKECIDSLIAKGAVARDPESLILTLSDNYRK